VLDGEALVTKKTDVAVKVSPTLNVQLGPKEIPLCGGIVGDNVLAAGKGRYCTSEKQDGCKHQDFHRQGR
jgi:hypothetical protein